MAPRAVAIVPRPPPPPRPAAPANRSPAAAELRRLAHAAARTLRDDGTIAVVQNVLAIGGVRRLTVFRRSPDVERGGRVPPGIAIRAVTVDDLDAYRALRPDAPMPEMRRRVAAGHVCIGAWRNERLLSVRWLARGRAESDYLRVSFALAPGVRYEYDGFTAVAERRTGLSAILTDTLIRLAASEGTKAVITAVLPENHGGMRLARRDPQIGTLRTVSGGRRLLVSSNLPPGYLDDPTAL